MGKENILQAKTWATDHLNMIMISELATEGITNINVSAIMAGENVVATRDEVAKVIALYEAWQYLLEYYQSSWDVTFIKELNNKCLKGQDKGSGVLRKVPVTVRNFSKQIPVISSKKFRDDVDWISKIANPEDKAVVMFCYIVQNQPFINGNIITAQLIMNKILIENGIGTMWPPKEDINKFHLAIQLLFTDDAGPICEYLKQECIRRV